MYNRRSRICYVYYYVRGENEMIFFIVVGVILTGIGVLFGVFLDSFELSINFLLAGISDVLIAIFLQLRENNK